MSKSNETQQSEFYISKGEETLGPWTIEEIANRLAQSEIAVTDFVYDDGRKDWIPLMECAPLKEVLRSSKPKAPPPPARKPSQEQTVREANAGSEKSTSAPRADGETAEWFVQKGDHRYGPFTRYGLIRALQEKSIFEFDLVWKNGMDEWVRLAEHEEFQAERIRELQAKMVDREDVFFPRRNARVPFEREVIVHDNHSLWMGQSFEGSAGGSGVVIENATLVPGQVVLVHFAANDELPAFNALCEIVSKRFSRDVKDEKSPVAYGVRFVKLDSSAETRIQDFFKMKAKKNSADSELGYKKSA